MKTSTFFSLMAEFNSAQIPLDDLCEKYFNLSSAVAKREAARQSLPVPVLKLRSGQKSRYFVKAEHLAEYIDEQAKQAKLEWQSVNSPSKNHVN